MSWLYVPGLVASNSDSNWPSHLPVPSAGLNGTPAQPSTWSRAWKAKPWLRGLSGATCEPSTAARGVESWIASLRASRASRSASPGSSGGMTTPGICGRTLPGSLARFALNGASLRTSRGSSQLSLLTGGPPSSTSSEISASWVTNARRASSQRQKWARRIFANGSSSWPTHTANPATYSNGERGPNLHEAAVMWPTPSVADLTGGHANWGGDRQDEMLLPGQARELSAMWATPAARDVKGANGAAHMESRERPHEDQLANQAIWAFPPSPQAEPITPHGGESSPSAPTSRRRLNPVFTEWLMGWPLGWTDLDSPLPGTELSRWRRHMRGSLSLLGWEVEP